MRFFIASLTAPIVQESRRIFEVCHGCRRCFNLCNSFPRLFDLIDKTPGGALEEVPSKQFKVLSPLTVALACRSTACLKKTHEGLVTQFLHCPFVRSHSSVSP